MAEGISQREFARQVGLSIEAVRKAIAEGKIPADCLGEKRLSTGKVRKTVTDPARAAEHWGKNRDPNQVRDKATMSAGAKRGWEGRRGREAPAAAAAPPAPAPARGKSGKDSEQAYPDIIESRRETEAFKAKCARLDYEERVGILVNSEQVKAQIVNMITAAKSKLLGVPSKAKARIPTLTLRDIEALEDLISEALEELAIGS